MSITRTSSGPTIVLVHGAFAESSSWNGVVDLLLEDDVPVLAVANPLRSVRADSEDAELIGEAALAAASGADGGVAVERAEVGA